jgi:hypothetical protein
MFEKIDMHQAGWASTDLPIQLKVSSDIDSSTMVSIADEMTKWEDSINIDFFSTLESTPPLKFSNLKDYYLLDKETNGIYFSDTGSYTCIPRLKTPLTILRKAILSLCALFIFACILNMNPENIGFDGSIGPWLEGLS